MSITVLIYLAPIAGGLLGAIACYALERNVKVLCD